MVEATIQVNRQASLQVVTAGEAQTPVIIIDNFAVDTRPVIDHACVEAEFAADATSAYPGMRASLSRSHVIAQLNALFPLLRKVYSIPEQLKMRPVNTVYSLVSTPEPNLKLLQCLPHFDSPRPYYFAITHYLNPGPFGGTGLYRHKPTGFEAITEDRLSDYVRAGDAFLARHGNPPQRYFGDTDSHYELYERIDYQPNRLVAYPGYLLHSGLINPAVDINPDPRTGRLTTNTFVDFQ